MKHLLFLPVLSFAQPWTWPAGWERKPIDPKPKEQLELDLEMNQTYSHRASVVNKEKDKCKESFKKED